MKNIGVACSTLEVLLPTVTSIAENNDISKILGMLTYGAGLKTANKIYLHTSWDQLQARHMISSELQQFKDHTVFDINLNHDANLNCLFSLESIESSTHIRSELSGAKSLARNSDSPFSKKHLFPILSYFI